MALLLTRKIKTLRKPRGWIYRRAERAVGLAFALGLALGALTHALVF